MPIPLYAVEAHSGQVITLDDQAVVNDQAAEAGTGGNAITPYIVSTPFDTGEFGGYATFRRAVQLVHVVGAATVTFTPYRDGVESGDTIARTLSAGDSPVVGAPLKESGSAFQIKVAVSGHDATVELGKAEQFVHPRRSQR